MACEVIHTIAEVLSPVFLIICGSVIECDATQSSDISVWHGFRVQCLYPCVVEASSSCIDFRRTAVIANGDFCLLLRKYVV